MFQRLLFERIEQRILVGTLAVLGIMAITGWIAINEGARMRSFEEEFLARSTERGAMLFAANCTACHGADGRGLPQVAPGLNNPALFGFDFLAEINAAMAVLNGELTLEGTTEERKAEINTELETLQQQHDQLLAQIQPAIDKGYNPEAPSRLGQLGWGGSLTAFVHTTLIHGRPTSGAYWPNPMPAWSQIAGGPLRDDQLNDLVNYVLNFDQGSEWTLDDLLAVQQFAKIPGASGGSTLPEGEEPVGADADPAVVAQAIEETPGDPVNGEQLYTQLACAGCHVAGVLAPATAGTWTRVLEERLAEPQFEGYTGVHYLVESILHPNNYVVPGFTPGLMPQDFGARISQSQLADLVAYLMTHDEP